uniref:3-hydroxybutyryl-CoA epimerase n=1 Tax=Globodera pallida TaxID=36090 RepID=A0A183BN94_GLOPA
MNDLCHTQQTKSPISTPPSPSTAAQSPACKIEPSKPKIDAEPGKFTENTVVKTAGRKDAVTWSLKGQGIAVLKIDIPDVKENTLNEAVSEDLRKAFDAIEQNSSVRGVVLMSNKPNSFVAGADIGMLSRCNTADAAARISRDAKIHFDRMEGSKKPG